MHPQNMCIIVVHGNCCLQATATQKSVQGRELVSSGRKVLPALGLAWSHCMNLRLFAARHDANGTCVRSLQVRLSHYA